MSAFATYTEGQYKYWTYPVTLLRTRFGQRSGYFVQDIEWDSTGFAGTENVNWGNLRSQKGVLTGTFREGVLNTKYVLQCGTNFAGTEGIDYETLITS